MNIIIRRIKQLFWQYFNRIIKARKRKIDINKIPVGLVKPKEAQEKEIETYFKPYASAICGLCFGRGHIGFNAQRNQYVVCDCVTRNIEKEKLKAQGKAEIILLK